jgi:hypothetical protein
MSLADAERMSSFNLRTTFAHLLNALIFEFGRERVERELPILAGRNHEEMVRGEVLAVIRRHQEIFQDLPTRVNAA